MRGDEHTTYDGAAPAAATGPGAAPTPATTAGTSDGPDVHAVLRSRGYILLLVAAAVLALPLSALAFGFLAGIQWLQQLVWQGLPEQLGWATPPIWFPLPVLGLAGLAVGTVIRYLPGRGGHVPADGLGGGLTEPRTVPGVVLAAVAGLSLGAVVGPEAPLIALGGGLALLAADRTRLGSDPQGRRLIALAGSAAAIATIFGNPLVAVILLLEVVAIANKAAMLAIVPCLVSSGVGALLFTGLGSWTGLPTGTLALPDVGATTLDWVDLVAAVPLAAAVALLMHGAMRLGRRTAAPAVARPVLVAVVAGLGTGALAGIFALLTNRSPMEVLTSGQAALPGLVAHTWPVGVLLLLLLCKGAAYALCLGAFRGGPTFPAIFLGGVAGVLAGHVPGLGTVPGMAICMAAGMVAIVRLPVTSALLVVLLLGPAATSQMPVVLVATVTALIVAEVLDRRRAAAPPASAAAGASPTASAGPAAASPTSSASTAAPASTTAPGSTAAPAGTTASGSPTMAARPTTPEATAG
jgi:H+/Cl- antiporter ClcA